MILSSRSRVGSLLTPIMFAIILLSGMPSGPAPGHVPSVPPTVGLGAGYGTAPGERDPPPPRSAPLPSLPGSDSRLEPFLDAPAYANLLAGAPGVHASGFNASPGAVQPRPTPGGPATLAHSSRSAAADGNVTGHLVDRQRGTPVGLANFSVRFVGEPCPCATQAVAADGTFSLTVGVGVYWLNVSAPGYSPNATTFVFRGGGDLALGVVYLDEDGRIVGRLVGADPTGEAVGAVKVVVSSRDGLSNAAQRLATSSSTGRFEIDALPGDDRIDFDPGGLPYLANFTYASISPGARLNLGVVELVRMTNVSLRVVDRATGLALASALPEGGFICATRQPGNCGPYGFSNAGKLALWAAPGAGELTVVAEGYVVNRTELPLVPVEPVGRPFSVQVGLTPEGAVRVHVGVSGGSLPTGENSTPGVQVMVCSLNGLTVGVIVRLYLKAAPCVNTTVSGAGASVLALAPPLRDAVELPSYFGGPVPLFLNNSWVNVTPDRIADGGYLNWSPGAYVSGSVRVPSEGGASPPPFGARACSTDLATPAVCGSWCNYQSGPSGWASSCLSTANATRLGCLGTAGTFCLPAPQGPDRFLVDDNASSVGAQNYTWGDVPVGCCLSPARALPLDRITAGRIQVINLSAASSANGFGWVNGIVLPGAGTFEPPVSQVLLSACPAANLSDFVVLGIPCEEDFAWADPDGGFALVAPTGWDAIVAAPEFGYDPNWTWIDVQGGGSAGPIGLTPRSIVLGKVVDANGTGLFGANVSFCPMGSINLVRPPPCESLNTANSEGEYAGAPSTGLLPGLPASGPFPGSSYEVTASASGFVSNFTWFNATPGGLEELSPIVLTPITANVTGNASSGSSSTGGGPPASIPPGLAWVTGRILDNRTGTGVGGVTLAACPLSGASCVDFSDPTSAGGEFNQSVPVGGYTLEASSPGYGEGLFPLNATSPAPVAMGPLWLVPFAWVTGRLALAPWSQYSLRTGFGPGPATVLACLPSGICGPDGWLDSGGDFAVLAPPGHDTLWIAGSSIGFEDNFTTVKMGANNVTLSSNASDPAALSIDGAISGTVLDASDPEPVGQGYAPVPWPVVGCGPRQPGWSCRALPSGDAGGAFLVFVSSTFPPDIWASQQSYVPSSETVPTPPGAGGIVYAAPLKLTHFGWVGTTIRAANGTPVPFASLSYSLATASFGTGAANAAGIANLSAPPTGRLNVSISAPGYVSTSYVVNVTASLTTELSASGLSPASSPVEVLRSPEVNDSAQPSDPAVRDPYTDQPVAGAQLWLANGTGDLVGTTYSNGLGQFLYPASPPGIGNITVSAGGYEPVQLPVPAAASGTVEVPRINLTADGIVAAQVIAEPGGQPFAGVNVTACEYVPAGGCSTIGTNGIGLLWMELPPGIYLLNLSVDGEGVNTTFSAAVTPDNWTWLGHLDIASEGWVTGTVAGLPFATPISGANVTICPIDGSYFPYCAATTASGPTGGFEIPVRPGIYYIDVSAPGYAPWSLEIEVAPAQWFDIGTIPLSPLGAVFGRVVDASTGLPIGGATVVACYDLGPGCAGPVASNGTGEFFLAAVRPGAEELEAKALGYTPVERDVRVYSGEATDAGAIGLWPGGPVQEYAVQGVVTWNDTGLAAAGMTVTAALPSGGTFTATVSGPNGSFALTLAPGPYVLRAVGPGAVASELSVTVRNASVAGLALQLDRMRYDIGGVVTVAGGQARLAGVLVSAVGSGGTLTAADGSFELALPNGSYRVTARPTGAPLLGEVGSAEFGLTVNGAGGTEDIVLPTVGARVTIDVVAGPAFRPVGGATVTVSWGASLGVAEQVTVATGPNGTAVVMLPAGVYAGYVNATGYSAATLAIDVGPPAVGGSYRVLLSEVGGVPTSFFALWGVPVVVAAVASVGTIGFLVGWRWHRGRWASRDRTTVGPVPPL